MDERDQRGFLHRWSRLKEEARDAPPAPASQDADSAAPVLPPLETLTPESDFRPFFHPKVEQSLRRAALKKLFADPRFNVMDGLDVYIDDYSKSEPLPEAMLEKLEQARKIMRWAREDKERAEDARLPQEPAAPQIAQEGAASAAQETQLDQSGPASTPPEGQPT